MQQWEYCDLYCDVEITQTEKYNHNTTRMEPCRAWKIHCNISYYTESDNNFLVCNDSDEVVTEYNNLFDKAMRLLGEAGWELVSIQHGNENIYSFSGCNFGETYSESVRHNNLLYNNKIAYFKRPKIEGRNFDVGEIRI